MNSIDHCLILWLATPYMSLADLLVLALAGKEGKKLATRELFSGRRTTRMVCLGARLVLNDIFMHRENRFLEFPPFFSITGQEIRLINWYVLLDILRCHLTQPRRHLKKDLAKALSRANNCDYRLLKAYVAKNGPTARDLMDSAVCGFLAARGGIIREPWWLGPEQRKMVFELLCTPFCCFCLSGKVSNKGENVLLLLIDETLNVHLACTACHSKYCAHVPFQKHGARQKLLL